jgi:hypothetical protein
VSREAADAESASIAPRTGAWSLFGVATFVESQSVSKTGPKI